MKIIGACVSDIGNSRKENQDRVFQKIIKCGRQRIAVGAVFDGIGGLEHGGDAADILYREMTDWAEMMQKNKIADSADVLFAHFKDEAENLNDMLREYISSKGIMTGSTMSVLMIAKNQYIMLQVGDSRIYRFRRFLEQITEDESCCVKTNGRYVKKLTNYMGRSDELSFLEYKGEVHEGDGFLFCSDGFYHHLLSSDAEYIFNAKRRAGRLEEKLEKLVKAMMDRGERDNISAGVFLCKKSLKNKKIFRRKANESGKL